MEAVVVGGGIVGASAAYRLALADATVTLIDRADTGQATAAGAGIISPGTSIRPPSPWYPLAFEAASYYPHLVEALKDDGAGECGYDNPGVLFLATAPQDHERINDVFRLVEERSWAGVSGIGDVDVLEDKEIRALFPPVAPGTRAVHASGAGRVNGRVLRDALYNGIKNRGGTVRHGSAEVVTSRGRVVGVSVDGVTVAADVVVLATGAWQMGPTEIGLDVPVAPQRGQILHLSVPGAETASWPMITAGFSTHYMLTFPPDRVVAGATREDGTGFDYRVTAGGQKQLLDQAMSVAPGLATASLVETRIGFRPASPDNLPIFGRVPGLDGLFLATGLGASGLTLGPLAGALVADLSEGKDLTLDIQPFSIERFLAPHR